MAVHALIDVIKYSDMIGLPLSHQTLLCVHTNRLLRIGQIVTHVIRLGIDWILIIIII